MRSVWGWTPASSAATEMTYRARSRSSVAMTSHPQMRSWVGGFGGGQRLDGLTLLVGERLRHDHVDRYQQVADAGAGPGHSPAPDTERLARCRAWRDPDGDGTV